MSKYVGVILEFVNEWMVAARKCLVEVSFATTCSSSSKRLKRDLMSTSGQLQNLHTYPFWHVDGVTANRHICLPIAESKS